MPSPWYLDFFSGVVVDYWIAAVPPEQTAAEVDFLAQALAVQPGARLLDVPCGNGRHARGLAKLGYAVAGVDGSEDFLVDARRRAADDGVEVDWHRGDMRELPFESEIDGALCMGNSFGYLEHDGNRALFAAVSRALRPGARFVMDTGMAAESILPNFEERDWVPVGDLLFLTVHTYRAEFSRLDTEYTFVRDGEVVTARSEHHVYTVAELKRMIAEAGLETEVLLAGIDGEPFEFGSPRLLLVARKPA